MHPKLRNRWILGSLALLLPLALAAGLAAEEVAPKAGEPAPVRTADELRALNASIDRGLVGTILHIAKDTITVRDLTEGRGGSTAVQLGGGSDVAVTGTKDSWDKLAQGDLIIVSFRGDPARAQGIRVLPPKVHPDAKAAFEKDLFDKPAGREFVGWIKQVDDQTIVLRTPNGPIGSNRQGVIKHFARQPDTVVELLRDSWDQLKKGDRVVIVFGKGDPSPASRVKVVLRGGEKPLPQGIATRLFDPAYDQTVKDVDGIGEWPPGKPWPPVDEPAASSAAAPARTPAPAGAPAPAPAK